MNKNNEKNKIHVSREKISRHCWMSYKEQKEEKKLRKQKKSLLFERKHKRRKKNLDKFQVEQILLPYFLSSYIHSLELLDV